MAAPAKSDATSLPARGILHPGKSLAGVRLGDTIQRVKSLWGQNYKVWVCREKKCPIRRGSTSIRRVSLSVRAVRFRNGKVVTVFTLGSPSGWRTAKGS